MIEGMLMLHDAAQKASALLSEGNRKNTKLPPTVKNRLIDLYLTCNVLYTKVRKTSRAEKDILLDTEDQVIEFLCMNGFLFPYLNSVDHSARDLYD